MPDGTHYTDGQGFVNRTARPQEEVVTDKGADTPRKYFTQLPNIIDEMGLSPYEFRLYVHYVRVAGSSGVCNQGQRTIAKVTSMSQPTVSRARQSLAERQLINVVPSNSQEVPDRVEIVDIWEKNFRYFMGDSQGIEGDSERIGGDSHVNHKNIGSSSNPPIVPPLEDDVVEQCVALLLDTPTFNEGEATARALIKFLIKHYPHVDAVALLELYRARHIDGMETTSHIGHLRSYFQRENIPDDTPSQPKAGNKAGRSSATPEAATQAMFDYSVGTGRRARYPLRQYLGAARDFDFTSDEEPEWKMMQRLGGTADEQYKNLTLMRSIAQRAVREEDNAGR